MLCTTLLQAGWCVAQNTDIEFVHGSFYGGNEAELSGGVNALRSNNQGNVLLVGSTNSSNFPTTVGAHQPSLNGFSSLFFVLMDHDGQPIHSSYHGGPLMFTQAVGAQSTMGNIAIAGEVPGSGFATTPGAALPNYPGGPRSITLTYFDVNYLPVWSTFVGGSGLDRILDIALDADNNVYVCGSTTSAGLASSGAHLEAINVDFNAGFLAKYSPSGVPLFFTYFQGNGNASLSHCRFNNEGTKLYISGLTDATTGISFGGIEDTYQGGDQDAFVACFDISTNEFLWSRYLGGPAFDEIMNLAIGSEDEIVVSGKTRSIGGIASTGAHQEIPSNNNSGILQDLNRFIAVLDQDGNAMWATYFGAVLTFSSNFGLSVAGNELIVTGRQQGGDEITLGNPIVNDIHPEGSDFIAKFHLETGIQEWGTYWINGTEPRLFNAVHLPGNRLFSLGIASDDGAPISIDAWQSEFGGGDLDLYYAIFQDISLFAGNVKYLEPLKLFPNPASDEFILDMDPAGKHSWNVDILAPSGGILKSFITYIPGTVVDVADLPAGMYIVRATSASGIVTNKLVISR